MSTEWGREEGDRGGWGVSTEWGREWGREDGIGRRWGSEY